MLACHPDGTKVDWRSTSKGDRGRHPRIRQVASADYGDSRGGGGAGLDDRHLVRRSRRRRLSRSRPSPGTGPTARPGRLQCRPRPRRARPRQGHATTRSLGPRACSVRARPLGPLHRGLRPPGGVHAAGDHRLGPLGRSGRQGPVLLRRRIGETVATGRRHPGRRPHRPAGLRRGDPRRRGTGLSAQRAHRRRCPACSCTTRCRPAGRDGVDRVGRCAAGSPGRPAGCRALVLAPGDEGPDEVLAAVGDGLFVQSMTGVHSGVNPVSGDFSVGAEGLMIRGGCAGRAGARGHRRVHPPAHAPVGGRRSAPTSLAPRRGGRPDPGHRRHGAQRRLRSGPQVAAVAAGLASVPAPEAGRPLVVVSDVLRRAARRVVGLLGPRAVADAALESVL